jgi:hypothetical protein
MKGRSEDAGGARDSAKSAENWVDDCDVRFVIRFSSTVCVIFQISDSSMNLNEHWLDKLTTNSAIFSALYSLAKLIRDFSLPRR